MATLIHQVNDNVLRLEYDFLADQQQLWDAYSQKDAFCAWWGPKGWSTEVKKFEFRESGEIHYGMKCQDPAQTEWYGKYSWGKMVFSKITPIERLEYTDYFVDERGSTLPGLPTSETRMDFSIIAEGTRLVSYTSYETKEALSQVLEMGMLEGVKETYERLAEFVDPSTRT